MLEEFLCIVLVWKKVNKVDERRVNDMYFSRALYRRAKIKDIVRKVFGRLKDRECWRDAGSVKRKATIIVHKLIRSRYTGFFKKRILPRMVPINEETVPLLSEVNTGEFIVLPVKTNTEFEVNLARDTNLVVMIFPKAKGIEEAKP